MKARLLPLVLLLTVPALVPSAKADSIYTYTGNNYTICGGTYCTGGPYALSIVFSTTLTGSALNNLPFTNVTSTISSYTFTDGSGLTLTQSNNASGTLNISISTNASGNIVSWFVGAYTLNAIVQMQTNWNSPLGFIPGADFSETTPNFAGNFGFIGNNPGTWTSAAPVPEPPSFRLLGTGLGALMVAAWRRRKKPCRARSRSASSGPQIKSPRIA
jgi:hypothetical protein